MLKNEISVEGHLLEDLILKIIQVASSQNIDFFMIGATARDFIFTEWNISPERATRDVDFGVCVSSWKEFEELSSEFLARGFKSTSVLHRFSWSGIPVDIIPFGGIERPKGNLIWPGGESAFSTIGFADAFKSSHILKSDGGVLRVASLAGLFLLKLIAWNDRPRERVSDAADMANIMQRYLETGHEERLYGEHMDLIGKLEPFDLRRASAALLGRDLKNMCSSETKLQALSILENELNDSEAQGLIIQMPPILDNIVDITTLLNDLCREFS